MSSPGKSAAPWAVKLIHEGQQQGLPAAKIRQKLVLEGAEPEMIDSLFSQEGQSAIIEPVEPSSPCTSPQQRQLSSRRFNDMLSAGLPPSSVRQKMAMEGCPLEEINSFFAVAGGGSGSGGA